MTTRTNPITEIDLLPLLEQDLGTGKRTGQNITWHCPFHQDDTPSFVYSPAKHIVTCFGACDHTWDAAGYVMQRDHCDYSAALRTLGVSTRLNETEALAQLRARGLTPATIQQFQITPNTRKQAWQYPVAEGNRYKAFDSQAERKYWHDKGVKNQWYGLDCVQGDTVYLCEGESDVWIMAQMGFAAVSGIYGAGKLPTCQPLRDRGVKHVLIVYDNDDKGKTTRGAAAAELRAAGFTVEIMDVGGAEGNDMNRLYLANPAQFAATVHALPEVLPPARENVTPVSQEGKDWRTLRLHKEIIRAVQQGYNNSAVHATMFGDRRGAQTEVAIQLLAVGLSEAEVRALFTTYPIGAELSAPQLTEVIEYALWRLGKRSDELRDQIAELRGQRGSIAQINRLVYAWLREHGYFAHTPGNQLYYFSQRERQLYNLESYAFIALLQYHTGVDQPTPMFKHMTAFIKARCHREGVKALIARFAYYDQDEHVLRVSRFNGEVYRLDGETRTTEDNGAGGIIFDDYSSWQPFTAPPRATGVLPQLLQSFNWQRGESTQMSREDQTRLWQLWLLATFFAELLPTRPILALTGGFGAGKTFALRAILKILYGASGEVCAFPTEQDDFETTIANNYHVFFDNADTYAPWTNDALARLATGQVIERRKLYSTGETESFTPRCYTAITTRTVDFRREDVASRLLVLNLEPREENTAEGALLQQLAQHRADYWGDLLSDLQAIIRQLRQSPKPYVGKHRLGDFCGFVMQAVVALGWGKETGARLLRLLDTKQKDLVLEDEPLVPCLEEWLQDPANQGREVTAKELFDAFAPPDPRQVALPGAESIAAKANVEWPYKTAKSLGMRLSAIAQSLSSYFVVKKGEGTEKKNMNRGVWRFWLKTG